MHAGEAGYILALSKSLIWRYYIIRPLPFLIYTNLGYCGESTTSFQKVRYERHLTSGLLALIHNPSFTPNGPTRYHTSYDKVYCSLPDSLLRSSG